MYEQLEQRRKYYSSKFPDAFSDAGGNDSGSDVLMRQLCNLEVSISKDAAAGKSIDKSVNSLNTLIGCLLYTSYWRVCHEQNMQTIRERV